MRRRRGHKHSLSTTTTSGADRLEQAFLSYQASGQPIKLHIGCGPRVLKTWINIDRGFEAFEPFLDYYTDRHYGPSVRGTRDDFFSWDVAASPLPLPDHSVDLMFHEDFLEHLSQRDQYLFLAESRRVLKRDGLHRISTPNLKAVMQQESDFSSGFPGVFVQEWDAYGHIFVHTVQSLTEMVQIVGYMRVAFNGRDESARRSDLPSEFRPVERQFEDANLFCDLRL